MRVSALFGVRRQAQVAPTTDINNLAPAGSRTAFALASIAAAALIFSAGAQNVVYGWTLGAAHSAQRALILALASAGATLISPLCFLAVRNSWTNRNFGAALVSLVLGCGAMAYASTCSLGFVTGSRDVAISARSGLTENLENRRALAKSAHSELGTLRGQRGDIMERRSELTSLLERLAEIPDTGPAIARPETQAEGVAFILSAMGVQTSIQNVAKWVDVGTVLFLELAAALSLTIVAQFRPQKRQAPPAPVEPKPQQRQRQARDDDDKDDTPNDGKRGRPATVLPHQAVQRLRKAGGQAEGTVRGIGKLIGTKSRTTTRRLLNKMAQDGLLTLSATQRGVSVALN